MATTSRIQESESKLAVDSDILEVKRIVHNKQNIVIEVNFRKYMQVIASINTLAMNESYVYSKV